MKKRGFSLIELLVVVSVIALLIMILLPSLSRVKNMASLTNCKSNKHAIGVAIINYVADCGDAWSYNNNTGPRPRMDMPWDDPFTNDGGPANTGPGKPANATVWCYGNPAIALTQDFDPHLRATFAGLGLVANDGLAMRGKQNYLTSAKYFFCPLFYHSYDRDYARYPRDDAPTNTSVWGTDIYLYNKKFSYTGGAPLAPTTITLRGSSPTGMLVPNVNNPGSDTALLADYFAYDWGYPTLPTANPNYFKQAKTHCNMLMLDGSAKSFTTIRDVYTFLWGQQPPAANTVSGPGDVINPGSGTGGTQVTAPFLAYYPQ